MRYEVLMFERDGKATWGTVLFERAPEGGIQSWMVWVLNDPLRTDIVWAWEVTSTALVDDIRLLEFTMIGEVLSRDRLHRQ